MGLKERLATLREDRAQRAEELATLDELIGVLERRLGKASLNTAKHNYVARMAWEVLRSHGRPLTTGEVAQLLLMRGYRTKAKNFSGTVYTRMSEAPTWFEKLGDGRWRARGNRPPFERPEPAKIKRISGR